MKNIARVVLVGLAAFFFATAGLMRFWAPGQAEKTPLNTDVVVRGEGPAKVLNTATNKLEDFTLRSTRTLRVDSVKSTKDVRVVVETLCTVKVIGDTPDCVDTNDKQNRLLQFTTDRRAEDAHTALAINDPKFGEDVNGDTTIKHVGLGYKFPFNSKKQSYLFFDTIPNKASEARYIDTKTVDGLKCYHYQILVKNEKYDLLPGLPVIYNNTRDVWVDPLTGVIVDGSEHVVQTLLNGTLALELQSRFVPDSIKAQGKLAKDGHTKVQLLTVIVPALCVVLGLAALVGALLAGRFRSAPPAEPAPAVAQPDNSLT